MQPISQLHKAARWYARHGYHCFPLIPGTKEPLQGSHGFKDATTSIDQIDRWWSENPSYNIGIACGPSGLVVLDFDTYKSGIHTDILFDDDELVNTVISRTPHGGTHVWFKQPPDTTLSNARGGLPYGVDVRGQGGYIVAPPSTLAEGGQYGFLAEHRPSDTAPACLPPQVEEILRPQHRAPRAPRGPQTASEREIAEALAHIPEKPGYDKWLSILMAVHSILPDNRGVQLCEEWSPGYKGEVAKKFASFRRDGTSIATLFHIAKEYGYKPPPPPPSEKHRDELLRLRAWTRSPHIVTHLKRKGITRVSELISVLDALIVLGHDRDTWRVTVTHRTLADICDIAPVTAWRRVEKLKETGMIDVEKTENGTAILLDNLRSCVSETDFNNNTTGSGVSLTHEEMEWQAAHRADDAFTSYPYWSAVKRRGDVAPLMASLGATGWLLWPHLRRGGTLDELVEATGLGVSAVRHTIKKYMSCGLIPQDAVNKQGYYHLISGADTMLDEVRPHMVTCGVGQMRMGRNFSEAADYASFRLRQRKKMDPKDVRFWEDVELNNTRKAALYFDSLLEQGFDARMKVGKEKRIRPRIKIDYKELWRDWGRKLYDAYNALGDVPMEQKVRLLTIAQVGADATPDAWGAAYRVLEERVDMMLMMAPKRAEYEAPQRKKGAAWEPEDYFDVDARLGFTQLHLFEEAA